MNAALRALNRFGLGARPGEAAGLTDPRGWLRVQITPAAVRVPAPDQPELGMALRELRSARDPAARRAARARLQRLSLNEQLATLARRVRSSAPFAERLVAFWSNHLCVSSAGKAQVAPLAGSYERDVVRQHLFGHFADMVLASAQHPAMLIYLDNVQSVGPNARGLQRRPRARRQRGLNENYARELLELHTLGVDGGYTQQDVTELARILTGWTVSGLTGRATNDRFGFHFDEALHEPGDKTLLGVTYHEAGQAEGERAIRALCRHPATARFIARKLAAHFIADAPPTEAVAALAQTFRATDGDLSAVYATLVELPQPWSSDARKLRAPQDWLVAVLRALEIEEITPNLVFALRQLRHPLWAPAAPKGFGDSLQDWADPDSLLNRAELARTLARRFRPQARDPRVLLSVVDVAAGDPLHNVLADTRTPAPERLALALAAPAFQWR